MYINIYQASDMISGNFVIRSIGRGYGNEFGLFRTKIVNGLTLAYGEPLLVTESVLTTSANVHISGRHVFSPMFNREDFENIISHPQQDSNKFDNEYSPFSREAYERRWKGLL